MSGTMLDLVPTTKANLTAEFQLQM